MVQKDSSMVVQDSGCGSGGGELLGRSQRYLLEACTVLYFIGRNSITPLAQQYIYFLVARKYLTDSAAITITGDHLTGGVSDNGVADVAGVNATPFSEQPRLLATPSPEREALLRQIGQESNLIILYLNVAELLPSAIIVLLLGIWSDLTGRRKFLMWLPCFGNAIYSLGMLIPLYACDGRIDSAATKACFVLASICSGCCGSVPAFLSGNASYISDTDTPKRRTIRLAIVEFSIGMTFAFGSLANGLWIRVTQHYTQPLIFCFICSIVPMFIIFFALKEPNGDTENLNINISAIKDFRGIRKTFGWGTFQKKKLWALFISFQIYVFVQQGQERTFVLFLQDSPMFWGSLKIGSFLFVLYAISGLGCYPGIPILSKQIDDEFIAVLAFATKAIGSVILAFSRGNFMVYLSSVIQMFHLTPYAVSRSMISKQAGDNEQGSVYALLHSIQSVSVFLGPLVHMGIQTGSAGVMSGFVFLIGGPLMAIPILLVVWTKYAEDRPSGYYNMDASNETTKCVGGTAERGGIPPSYSGERNANAKPQVTLQQQQQPVFESGLDIQADGS